VVRAAGTDHVLNYKRELWEREQQIRQAALILALSMYCPVAEQAS
jgi:hypothetical protein